MKCQCDNIECGIFIQQRKAVNILNIIKKYCEMSLVIRILCGLVIGAVLGIFVPGLGAVEMLGDLFVGSLKAIAPLLVATLVVSSISQGNAKLDKRFGLILFLYVLSTFLAAVVAVVGSFLFPQTLIFAETASAEYIPTGVGEVLKNLLVNMVANPLASLVEGKYIGILFWALVLGIAFKTIAKDTTKQMFTDLANGVSAVVRGIIHLAPFGILGLVYSNVSTNGLSIFTDYGKLLALLVGCMLTVALVVDPLVAGICMKRNPYPLVWRCLKESGLTAFFTRSSAANIPVNMQLCEKLGLDKDMYSVSIPLGATINMDGAAITITVMTLAAANTVGIHSDILSALMLSFIATLGACGASGVAGGSLLLIPMACSMFGIPQDVAMQVVGIGFIVGVVQDSVETALNSAGDVVFAATAEYTQWIKEGRELPEFMNGKKKK
ncbi:MAG: serine/threonine transporter SstT [Clostridia bacterium]|nr:serine/threonine transporter SstT [Clostridia bacterium]